MKNTGQADQHKMTVTQSAEGQPPISQKHESPQNRLPPHNTIYTPLIIAEITTRNPEKSRSYIIASEEDHEGDKIFQVQPPEPSQLFKLIQREDRAS